LLTQPVGVTRDEELLRGIEPLLRVERSHQFFRSKSAPGIRLSRHAGAMLRQAPTHRHLVTHRGRRFALPSTLRLASALTFEKCRAFIAIGAITALKSACSASSSAASTSI
jgi:hypothetical protein